MSDINSTHSYSIRLAAYIVAHRQLSHGPTGLYALQSTGNYLLGNMPLPLLMLPHNYDLMRRLATPHLFYSVMFAPPVSISGSTRYCFSVLTTATYCLLAHGVSSIKLWQSSQWINAAWRESLPARKFVLST